MKKHIITYFSLAVVLGFFQACNLPTTDTFERFQFLTDNAKLVVTVDGNIDSDVFMLLLHGGPGGGVHVYNEGTYSVELEKEMAMVYLDTRGHGGSTGQYDRESLTLDQVGEDIYQVARMLKAKFGEDIQLFLMGHSWGGTTGTNALINTDIQDLLEGWIEVSGAHDIPLLNATAIDMFKEIGQEELDADRNPDFWEEVLEFVEPLDRNNVNYDDEGQLNAYGHQAEGRIEAVNYAEEEPSTLAYWTIQNPSYSFTSAISNLMTGAILNEETSTAAYTNRLNEITIPTLLLWGKYDFVVPPALGFSAYEEISTPSEDKYLTILENSGHTCMVNEPELFVEEVLNFVRKYAN
ncbi:MAG: alpha/beta hydrolase [Bacteroidota bacterium]